ncbi:transmembrane protein DUF3566 [Sediminihabitans luteus]|uniref:Transmembrane protein DUF3566 n=1 Tax=Sediminihabitans luteus TaxID=1138585 RepID=A0A2M9CCR6_9CELL|nr:DUF3566 domain-containing protein [Sediminihabitans luteus]PJJ69154.1 transmembrane protein DUF3566 [Sediminihabitans luteus]GII98826.1 hypothetical protein Slu03_12040 [Sediminihabitans luteus]
MTSNDHTTTGAATRPAGPGVPPPPPPAAGAGSGAQNGTANGSTGAASTSPSSNGQSGNGQASNGQASTGTAGSGVRNSAARAAAAAVAAAKSAAQRVATVSVTSEDELDERTVKRVPGSGAASTNPTPSEGASSTAGAQRPTQSVPPRPSTARTASATAAPTAAQPRPAADAGVRRVRLVVSRVDPWSVMKLSFILAFAVGIMTVVAIAMFWGVLNGLGVFTQINSLIIGIVGEETKVDVLQFVAFDRVLSLGALIAIVNLVLMTAIATILAFIYNIVAAVVGGIHLTLTDE